MTFLERSGENVCALFQIERGHCNTTNLFDFCDGEVFRSHPLFSVHSTALQIFFYYDDLEVCNPLGSKTKTHKLSKCGGAIIFFFVIHIIYYRYILFYHWQYSAEG